MGRLISSQIDENKEIQHATDKIMQELDKIQSQIQEIRPENPEVAEANQVLLKKVEDGRGRPLFYPYVGSGVGRGALVELSDGSVKLDFINGIGVNIFGHSHPKLTKAILRAAMSDIVMQGNLQPNTEYEEMLTRLKRIASKNTRLRHSWISTCGTMANENALKICRQKNTPAKKILAFADAFAGRSTLMAEVTDNPAYKVGLPSYEDVLRLDYYDEKDPSSAQRVYKQMETYIAQNPGDIACFVFEPIQGEGGFRVGHKEFILPLIELCKKNKIAVWADEVQTFCRSGEFFAVEKLGIAEHIDVMTIAKSLQAAATLYTEEYNPQAGLIAGTFAGSTASLAAGNAVLKEFEEGNYFGPKGRVTEIHTYFKAKLQSLMDSSCKGLLTDVSGMGLMVAITCFDGSKEKMMNLLKVLYKNGLISFGCGHGPYKVRFLIPAIVSNREIDMAVDVIERSLLELK